MADGSVNTNVLASGAYLPLAGGTLTGALSGTSASFSGNVVLGTTALTGGAAAQWLTANGTSYSGGLIASVSGVAKAYYYYNSIPNAALMEAATGVGINLIVNNSTTALAIASTGAATFSSSVTAGGNIVANKNNSTDLQLILNQQTSGYACAVNLVAATDSGAIYNYISSGTSGATAMWQIGGGSTANTMVMYTGGTERMRITSGGAIQMSNNATTFSIGSIAGVQRIQYGTGGFTTEFAFLQPNDGYTPIGASAFNTRSDYRLKEDLQDFDALDLIKNIKVYDFKWKENEERNYGFMAHELQEVVPYVVSGTKDGMFEDEPQFQGMDASKLVPILFKAIQEQQAQIDSLKNQIK
jgi:hypothetical protein